MFHVDIRGCTGCGVCIDACPQQAITMHDNLAMINEDLCNQCGACADICPAGAIREVVPAYEQAKGGEKMFYGFGRGPGRRGGAGFGFRGVAPPWPYAGRGRGGLPRCWYPGLATASPYLPAPQPYTSQMPRVEGIDWLKSQAGAIKAELNRVEARIHDLESSN